MNGQTELDAAITREARASVQALAAAERAVEEGRLNVAKVLRASALSARQRALAMERAATRGHSLDALTDMAKVNAASCELLKTGTAATRTLVASATSMGAILEKALGAVSAHRDVPETVVAQFLFVCEECGYAVEGGHPEICPACGSFGGEFALFAPFFSGTVERIARRTPDDIRKMLGGDADAMAAAVRGLTDAQMASRPGEGEWCIKEIAGHMIDIVEMAARRLAPIADPSVADPGESQLLPWRIIDGQDYPSKAAGELVDRYRRGLDALLEVVGLLQPTDWRKKTAMSGSRVAAIDVGSWVTNHNVAHLQQILALRETVA
jgi:rubrerythrin